LLQQNLQQLLLNPSSTGNKNWSTKLAFVQLFRAVLEYPTKLTSSHLSLQPWCRIHLPLQHCLVGRQRRHAVLRLKCTFASWQIEAPEPFPCHNNWILFGNGLVIEDASNSGPFLVNWEFNRPVWSTSWIRAKILPQTGSGDRTKFQCGTMQVQCRHARLMICSAFRQIHQWDAPRFDRISYR
jgi:hypothetical protein